MDAIIYALITGVAFNYAVWHIGREVRQARVGEFSGCAHPKGVFFFYRRGWEYSQYLASRG